jgi:hypothetical protein
MEIPALLLQNMELFLIERFGTFSIGCNTHNFHDTTTIEGDDIRNRFPGGDSVTYEFSIGSSNVIMPSNTKTTAFSL